MEYILLFMSVCVSVLYSSFSNVFSKKMMKNSSDFFLFNASVSLVGALVFLVLTIRDGMYPCLLFCLVLLLWQLLSYRYFQIFRH